MTAAPRARPGRPSLEYLLCAPVAAAIAYTAWFFGAYHHLPQPFFYEPSGTWMDWYSLTRWAHEAGAYEVEQSIYPPLSFVLMRVFSLSHCYALTHSEEARDCDWLGGVALVGCWLLNIALTFVAFRRIDRRTAIPRTFAMTCGFPMLYALERGNLLIFCYTCMLLAFGPLIRSARLRWLFAGVAVNFKVYLISAVFAPLLRRRWIAAEGMLLATVLVYLLTWFIMGEGSPAQVVRNVANYSTGFGAAAALDLWFPSTYIPVQTLLTGTFPLYSVMGSHDAEVIGIGVAVFTRTVQAAILAAAAAAWLRPEAVPPNRLVYLAVALALTTSEAGGYTEMLLLMFVFMERRRGAAKTAALLIAYWLSIPFDVTLGLVPPIVRYSWLSNQDVIVEFGVGLMSLLRPGLSMIIAVLLSAVTIRAVAADVRAQGWRGRRRFRRDLPVLTGPA